MGEIVIPPAAPSYCGFDLGDNSVSVIAQHEPGCTIVHLTIEGDRSLDYFAPTNPPLREFPQRKTY